MQNPFFKGTQPEGPKDDMEWYNPLQGCGGGSNNSGQGVAKNSLHCRRRDAADKDLIDMSVRLFHLIAAWR